MIYSERGIDQSQAQFLYWPITLQERLRSKGSCVTLRVAMQSLEKRGTRPTISAPSISIHRAMFAGINQSHYQSLSTWHICSECGKEFNHQKTLSYHIKVDHPTQDESHMCNECGDVFCNNTLLRRHVQNKHKKRIHACKYCDYTSYNASRVKEHERTHTGERPEICRFCGQGFGAKKTLRSHERLHTGEKPYACKYCDARFVLTNQNIALQQMACINQ